METVVKKKRWGQGQNHDPIKEAISEFSLQF